MTIFNPFLAQAVSELSRDKAAVVGAASSTAASAHYFTVAYPSSIEGWAALTASLATLVYVASKTYILWADYRKRS